MDALIEAFGSYSIGSVIVLVAAFVFLYKIYRKAAQAIVEQHDTKKRRTKRSRRFWIRNRNIRNGADSRSAYKKNLRIDWITSSSRRKVLSAVWKRSKRNASGKSVTSCVTGCCRHTGITQTRTRTHGVRGRKWKRVRFGTCSETTRKTAGTGICTLLCSLP